MSVQLLMLVPAVVIFWLALKCSVWFAAVGWLAHGPWDLLVPHVESISHMPAWYPMLCCGFDLAVGVYLSIRSTGRLQP
ncbi:MAG: hypothetical protein AAGG55_02125 [Pseudomonadota bacterium]